MPGGYTPRLWLAGELVPLVAVEVAAAAQVLSKPGASAVESNLDRVQADSERAGNLGVGESLLLAQDHDRTIARRQARNVLVDAVVHFSSNQRLLDTWRVIRYRGLVVDRYIFRAVR